MFIHGLIICVLPTLLAAQERTVLPRGHVFFTTDFEGRDALKGWNGPGVLGVGFQGGHALVLERPAEKGGGYATATIDLPVDKMRGYVVQFSARIKAQNVSHKPQPYNGVKFMAPIVTDQEKTWPAAELGVGTFDWQTVIFRAVVPEDAKQISLVVGLEAVTGKAWFDDIRVVAWKSLTSEEPRAANGPMYKGHDLPRLRGAMVSPDIDEAGLRVLGQQWNANLVRWQLVRREKIDNPLDLGAYDHWLQSALKQLDAALPLCEKYGLRVVVDLHSPPGGGRLSGGYAGSDHGLFADAACQRKFVEVWQHMAQRYKDSKAIWGYDLANEPVECVAGEDLADWQDLAQRAAKEIRAIDAQRAIIVEPPEWGNPQGLRELRPLAVPNMVYSAHMYLPHAFTHQGVYGSGKTYRYPGEIDGKRWDKAQLEAALKPVVEFQQKYNVHIYIGEFSAIRWAPDQSAHRYLKDLIDIFEAHDWDWSYHAFREWDGWSVEHGNDPKDHNRAKSPTDREQLLRSWFAKNRKPESAATVAPADESEKSANVWRRDSIIKLMLKVNEYQFTHPRMGKDDRNWERGTWYTGVMAAYKATGDMRFLKQAVQWGNQHRWQVGGRDSPANKLTCVQTWLELYSIDKNPAMIESAVKWLNSGDPLTPSGAKVWYLEDGRRYADSLYVGPPSLAMLAELTGDSKYRQWMHAFFWDVHAELFDKDAGLFYRDKQFIGKTTPSGKKIFWSRGNGWVMGGIVRILEHLPTNDPQRARYVELLKIMATAIAKSQGADGLWRANLGDPGQFSDPESSGTGFFCYALAWGINHDVLDRATYEPVVRRAWAGLVRCVSPEGKAMWGQEVGDQPAPTVEDQIHEYVTGTFLLAGSEMFKLSSSK